MPGRLPMRRACLGAGLIASVLLAGCSSGGDDAKSSAPAPVTSRSTSSSASSPASSSAATSSSASRTPSTTKPAKKPAKKKATSPAPKPTTKAAPHSAKLPLGLSTGNAKQLVTVTAPSHGSTRATLQRWARKDGKWTQVGDAVDAWLGSGGIGKASEGSSKTPQGSFTLTQAFGHNSNPGTSLPYFTTTPSDYWMSSPGPKYNTHQRCSGCGYDNGTNERLHSITPHYNYAVVIDYNTSNAPGGVQQGAGSAFFLHVSVGEPTAGCVAIPQDRLATLMRWLDPDKHPRILIGIG